MNVDLSRLRDMRIGYVPYRTDFSAPGDRRRFCFYANERGLDFDIPSSAEEYDIIVLSSLVDLTYWSRLSKKQGGPKLVYDMPDSYLEIDSRSWKARLRGPAKYLLRQHEHLEMSYHESIIRMCERADSVACSTPEQRKRLEQHSQKVFDILDVHSGDARHIKSDYSVDETIHLVWEGLADNFRPFAQIANALERVSRRHPLVLHLLTDINYKALNGPVPALPTRKLLDAVLPNVEKYLYEWNPHLFAALCTACDIAVIPMLRKSPLHMAKPENKLLLFWRMGLPVITDDTAAYVRTMADAGLDQTCANESDWETKLLAMIESEAMRRDSASKGRAFAEREHGREALLRKWDALFTHLLAC